MFRVPDFDREVKILCIVCKPVLRGNIRTVELEEVHFRDHGRLREDVVRGHETAAFQRGEPGAGFVEDRFVCQFRNREEVEVERRFQPFAVGGDEEGVPDSFHFRGSLCAQDGRFQRRQGEGNPCSVGHFQRSFLFAVFQVAQENERGIGAVPVSLGDERDQVRQFGAADDFCEFFRNSFGGKVNRRSGECERVLPGLELGLIAHHVGGHGGAGQCEDDFRRFIDAPEGGQARSIRPGEGVAINVCPDDDLVDGLGKGQFPRGDGVGHSGGFRDAGIFPVFIVDGFPADGHFPDRLGRIGLFRIQAPDRAVARRHMPGEIGRRR
ncbi:MAG: hypothetical protein BWY31_02448 [Lentisphaerae bacterium ADurb.Bin242]|nr:MAG: hypothetical protein BWY31_02448 [Lentisphaerae bacterium ADurb.Bin242]